MSRLRVARQVPDATDRLAALDAAVQDLDGGPEPDEELLLALPDLADPVTRARAVLLRAAQRRTLGGGWTVVALGGATGTGKSSLFNAVVGEQRASVGVRRPTTSSPVAGIVGTGAGSAGDGDGGTQGAAPLLDWLEIGHRHVVHPRQEADGLDGLILVDLPDIDSVQLAHQRTVDRLAQAVDVLVWVVDPQKYADNLLHQRYLRPMATHADVTLVVLNQADTLDEQERTAVLADLRRLLAADGLRDVPVVLTSARTGEGVADLRRALGDIADAHTAAEARLAADARAAGLALLDQLGSPEPAGVGRRDRQVLAAVLAQAAGVDAIADAVARSYRMRARTATGWPPTRWLARVRPDPLRRLGLARDAVEPTLVRSSRPQPTAVQRARVDGAVRALGVAASEGAADPWRTSIRTTAVQTAPDLADALDQAVVSTRLDTARTPRWWAAGRALQWFLLTVAVAGLLWLGVIAGVGYLQLPELPLPELGTVPWPTVLAGGGALAGLLLALLAGFLARIGARRRSRKVRLRLQEAVAKVADDVVVAPVVAEVDRCIRVTGAARRAAAD